MSRSPDPIDTHFTATDIHPARTPPRTTSVASCPHLTTRLVVVLSSIRHDDAITTRPVAHTPLRLPAVVRRRPARPRHKTHFTFEIISFVGPCDYALLSAGPRCVVIIYLRSCTRSFSRPKNRRRRTVFVRIVYVRTLTARRPSVFFLPAVIAFYKQHRIE